MNPNGTIRNFIRPNIPISPILSSNSLGRKFNASHSILDVKNHLLLTSGRVAIAQALQLIDLKKGSEVLVPAYHCSSMVEPVIWANSQPIFFKIKENTEIDLLDIKNKITSNTKAIIVTHYFGFHQPMPKLRALCDQFQIKIIEDCAHAFFGTIDGHPIGSFGDYAIASTMKFFPVFDGGCLASNRNSLNHFPLQTGGLGFQIKAAINTIEQSFEYKRLPIIRCILALPLWLKDKLWAMTKQHSKPEAFSEMAPASSSGGFGFNPNWLNKQMSNVSQYIIQHCDTEKLTQKRRDNYQYIHSKLNAIEGTHPLFSKLPDDVIPYVYPLYFDDPTRYFTKLKNKGVPIIRFGEFLWDGVNKDTCENSINLSQNVFQFPCHQELKQDELDWMINTIIATLKNT